MSRFKETKTFIKDLIIVEPTIFGDDRGFFMETYNKEEFQKLGINENFVQDNHSKSKKNVLRGLHFQKEFSQGKLVRVIKGCVWDVAVDLRNNSPTFGKWFGLELSEKNKKMFYIPKNFAHGFLTLEDDTEFQYKCTDFYHPEAESGIIWNDEVIGIEWPFNVNGLNEKDIIISEKDKNLEKFSIEKKYFKL